MPAVRGGGGHVSGHPGVRARCCAPRLRPPVSYARGRRSGECGNLGLKLLARGGVFIAGGIPGKLLPRIRGGDALQRGFLRPDCRFAPVRASMPLHVVLSKDPGLDGARAVALRALAAA